MCQCINFTALIKRRSKQTCRSAPRLSEGNAKTHQILQRRVVSAQCCSAHNNIASCWAEANTKSSVYAKMLFNVACCATRNILLFCRHSNTCCQSDEQQFWRQDLCHRRTTSLEQFSAQSQTMWAVIWPVQAVAEDVIIRTEAMAQCELFLTAPNRNILTYYKTISNRSVHRQQSPDLDDKQLSLISLPRNIKNHASSGN